MVTKDDRWESTKLGLPDRRDVEWRKALLRGQPNAKAYAAPRHSFWPDSAEVMGYSTGSAKASS